MPHETADRSDSAHQQPPTANAAKPGKAPRRERGATARSAPEFGSLRWRAGNAIASLLARAGIGPMHLLTTHGRNTGRPRTCPVVPVEQDGAAWLVASYGAVEWVHNARVAGRVSLRYARHAAVRDPRGVSGGSWTGPQAVRDHRHQDQTAVHGHQGFPRTRLRGEASRHPVFKLITLRGETT
jgi:deazaflavin-dependent oxidoreductase (nitroreductase family)